LKMAPWLRTQLKQHTFPNSKSESYQKAKLASLERDPSRSKGLSRTLSATILEQIAIQLLSSTQASTPQLPSLRETATALPLPGHSRLRSRFTAKTWLKSKAWLCLKSASRAKRNSGKRSFLALRRCLRSTVSKLKLTSRPSSK
jgi:hypothetical protein